MARAPAFSWRHLWLVAAGGAVGAGARLLILELSPASASALGVMAINVLGSLLLGVVFGAASRVRDPLRAARMRTFWGTGVMGGFTTYSAFAVLALGPWTLPLAGLTVLLGLAAAALGLWLARPRAQVAS